MASYTIVAIDDIPVLESEPGWKPLRHHLGIGAFGVNAWTAANAGDTVIERHDELVDCGCGPDVEPAGHEGLYVVARRASPSARRT